MAIIESYPEGIYRKNKNGEIILGKALTIFIHNGDFHLTDLKVFQDGKIDCWEGLINFEEFEQKVMEGWVRTRVPIGAHVSIFPIAGFKVETEINYIEEVELIKEVRDVLDDLNGKPTTSHVCFDAYEEYLKNPTDENRVRLKNAYENVPRHNRCYILGDMNQKDYPIQKIIYTNEELRSMLLR